MNKKGKEGGSTWFNRRQTEIPLFKINKKKKKADREKAQGRWGKVAAERGTLQPDPRDRLGRTLGEGPGELGTIKVFIFRVCASRCLGLGAGSIRPPLAGGSPPLRD